MSAVERSDADIVACVRAGDRDAFALLVARHQDALYRHGRGLGLDHDTALDLVQESLVKAYERLDQCRDAARFRAWLFRIFRNAMLDWSRDLRRREVPLDAVAEPATDGDEEWRFAVRDSMGAALSGLPPLLREAFLLRHVAGHSYDEIACSTGATLSAVKMRVARARDALRSALHELAHVTNAGPGPSSGRG